MEDFGLKALEVLAPFIVALLGWLSLRLNKYIAAKIKNEYASGVFIRLNGGVLGVVKELEQTVVADLKAANEDGKLTEEEKATIKANAIAKVKSYLGVKGLKELAQVVGLGDELEITKFLGREIEAAKHDVKAMNAAAAKPPLASPAS